MGGLVSRLEQRQSLSGRASECELLDELVSAVRRGQGRALLLRGEAGIGKTALLDYLVDSTPDLTVLRAVGVESEMELAFASLHQLCGPVLDRLGRLPAPQRTALEVVFGLHSGPPPDRFLVGLGVLSLLSESADERPLLCVVDDAQWLDQASALALAFVARRLQAEPVGIVFAAREPGAELRYVSELRVRGLRDADARALLGSAVSFLLDERVRDLIVAETRGNPLALLELPRGLTAPQLAAGFGILAAHSVSDRIEESFIRRLEALPEDTRRLLLIAAADPVGDPLLLWRAAVQLGLAPAVAADPGTRGLLEIGERVVFHHPLVRSAVYRAAPPDERRRAHLALATATDSVADPDRRAWHLAMAADRPDEQVAVELERSAGRAQARGGLAAAAAFLERATVLTPGPAQRVKRALAAAETSLYAGAFEAGLRLLAIAEDGGLEPFEHARVELLRARIEFATTRGGSAPVRLLRSAERIELFDANLARTSHLEALSAAMFAARLAGPGGEAPKVAGAVLAARAGARRETGIDLLLDGWAALFASGCAAATPTLRGALGRFTDGPVGADELHLLWLATITAPVVWDVARWGVLSERHVELARSSGALSELPLALNSRSYIHIFRGELGRASALVEEARAAIEATAASLTPWGTLALAALRGHERNATRILEAASTDATQRGEGISLTVIAWARALLYNGLGAHDRALAAARAAIDCPTNSAAAAWGMVELIEAAAQIGERAEARQASERLAAIAAAAGTDWVLGVNARSVALLEGPEAEPAYRRALDHLGRCEMRVDLARTHLLYGEWLRRQNRLADARAQLHAAHDEFTSIGMEAFAERARKELVGTGEKVHRRTTEVRDELTAQEWQIARLARDGLSNSEIGMRLFISPRTVEWHLRKVFSKLGIRSRKELAGTLSSASAELAPV